MPIKPTRTATHGISSSIYLDTYDATYDAIYAANADLHRK
jgi:hypothetical protein